MGALRAARRVTIERMAPRRAPWRRRDTSGHLFAAGTGRRTPWATRLGGFARYARLRTSSSTPVYIAHPRTPPAHSRPSRPTSPPTAPARAPARRAWSQRPPQHARRACTPPCSSPRKMGLCSLSLDRYRAPTLAAPPRQGAVPDGPHDPHRGSSRGSYTTDRRQRPSAMGKAVLQGSWVALKVCRLPLAALRIWANMSTSRGTWGGAHRTPGRPRPGVHPWQPSAASRRGAGPLEASPRSAP